jgi:predicted alpha/beta hydrolase family esterase
MQQVLFIQGAGSAGAHEEDRALADSLSEHLGGNYRVRYPLMPNEAEPDFVAWRQTIEAEMAEIGAPAFLVGHSIGASVLARIFSSDNPIARTCRGLFLASAPFWHDDAFWRWDECALPQDASSHFPAGLPVHLYHGEDDPFVPFAHMALYGAMLPQAVQHPLAGRDHQLNEDFSEIARDIAWIEAAGRS